MKDCLLFLILIFQSLVICVGIQVVKELFYIFCLSTFDHTFGHHQGSCSLSGYFSLGFIVLIICSVFILKWSVGTFSAFCFKMFSWKCFNKYIFCWMSFLIGLVILATKNDQYVGTWVKYIYIYIYIYKYSLAAWILWHINPCRLFNIISCLYIQRYIC